MPRDIISNFIVLEGIDGAGTTTQSMALGEAFSRAGIKYRLDCEPTPGPIGSLIRSILSGPPSVFLPETIAELYAADRREHVLGGDGVISACGSGTVVVSDRYFFSSLAYQGVTCGYELPLSLNSAFPLPEYLFFFDIDASISIQRLKSRKTLDQYENLPFQEKVESSYRTVIDLYKDSGMKIIRFDASASRDEITGTILRHLEPLMRRLEHEGIPAET